MQTPDSDGRVIALQVLDNQGKTLDLVLANQKSINKSQEQGVLWIVEGLKGRVLPYQDSRGMVWALGGFSTEDGINKVVVTNTVANYQGLGTQSVDLNGQDKTDTNQKGVAELEKPDANFIYDLETLVLQRRQTMPEGSYTTLLFKGGPAKIRKKTGEEAVELILADTPDTVASEASDLIYHMTVLLAALEIPWARVIMELKKR